MNFSYEIIDNERELSITLKNLSFEMLQALISKENMQSIYDTKFYMLGVYEKVEILDHVFMVLKNSKKNVVLLNVQ